MNKSTYITRKAALEAQIKTLNEEYIQANAEYKIGDKVKLTDRYTPNGANAMVSGIKINYSNDIEYILTKLKKDGTTSQQRQHYYNPYKIELL